MNLKVFQAEIGGMELWVLIINQLTIKIKNRTFAGLKKIPACYFSAFIGWQVGQIG